MGFGVKGVCRLGFSVKGTGMSTTTSPMISIALLLNSSRGKGGCRAPRLPGRSAPPAPPKCPACCIVPCAITSALTGRILGAAKLSGLAQTTPWLGRCSARGRAPCFNFSCTLSFFVSLSVSFSAPNIHFDCRARPLQIPFLCPPRGGRASILFRSLLPCPSLPKRQNLVTLWDVTKFVNGSNVLVVSMLSRFDRGGPILFV